MRNLGITDYLDQGIAAEPGDIIYCNEDNQIYEYYDEGLGKPFGWRPYKINKEQLINLGMTEYELNKMVVAQMPELTDFVDSKELICDFTHQKSGRHFYMLLCNELHYYTTFMIDILYQENIEDIIIECLQQYGKIKSINKTDDENAIECWVQSEDNVYMFMLFNYDWGIIECR